MGENILVHHFRLLQKEGVGRWIYFRLHRILSNILPAHTLVPINTFMGCRVYYRARTSDLTAYYQVFYQEQYSLCLPRISTGGIIDAGANVGYATIYFHLKCPKSVILAVEPDLDNFKLLKKNLQKCSPSVQALNCAVWSRETVLYQNPDFVGLGNEWARSFQDSAGSDTTPIKAVTIDHLIRKAGSGGVDLVKIDIEGGEVELLSGDCGWINNVQGVAIELHGSDARAAFERVFKDASWEKSEREEITTATRRRS